MQATMIHPEFTQPETFKHYPANTFPTINPVHWLHSHFAVGGWSPLQRLSGMLTAHMTTIAPRNGFTWHPHRGLEIYTWVLEGTLYHEDTTGGRGEIQAGEFQRMFSGDYIEHQELNPYDEPARVIQIWFMIDTKHMGVDPHYEQLQRDVLPQSRIGDGVVTQLIGGNSPVDQHMTGRLTATRVPSGGETCIQPPDSDEDLFLYVTDGSGTAKNGSQTALGQYDVILARAGGGEIASLQAARGESLEFLSFYLPKFLG